MAAKEDPKKKKQPPSSQNILDKYLTQVYLRAQSMHLLANLFPLDDVIIQPGIVPPPIHLSPDVPSVSTSLVHQELPYTPEWPELVAAYSVKSIPVTEVLRGGVNISLLGQAGAGKTAALAYLCGQVARRAKNTSYLNDLLPVLLHARDLIEFSPKEHTIDQLIDIAVSYHEDIPSGKLENLIRDHFSHGKVLVCLDGLDEFPRNMIQECHQFIAELLRQYPDTRLVITGPLDYIDGFYKLGTYPMIVNHWNRLQVSLFARKLAVAYFQKFETNLSEEEKELRTNSLLAWIKRQDETLTALEYSIQGISALAGINSGKTSFEILQSYVQQLVPNNSTRASLEILAYQTIISENPIINRYEIAHYVPELIQNPQSDTDVPQAAQTSTATVKPTKALSLVSKRIILQPTNRGNVIFTHPTFLGFMASNALIRNGQCQVVFDQPDWSAKELSLRYLAHLIDVSQYVKLDILDEGGPLYRKLFAVAHWMRECKTGAIFRPQIMRRLAQILNNENLSFTIRANAVASLVFANEKNIIGLFKQYCKTGSPSVKRLSALACGILDDESALTDLATLLGDEDEHVRNAATMAISIMSMPQAQDLTARILVQADENMRRVVAELVSLNPAEGKQTLKDGATYDDILVRRAAVYGLGLINEPWSVEILQKLQTEDGQWVIRNTAAQMLENQSGIDPHIPRQLPEPHHTPWLISYAARNDEGISPTASAVPLFFRVLTNGTDEEKIAALEYLSHQPDEGIVARMYDVIFQPESIVREYAIYTLWKLSLTGLPFPSMKKYGLG